MVSIRFGIFALLANCVVCHYPEWNQQCEDDAGPPFDDDNETFGEGVKYYESSSAEAVLVNGECPTPVADACSEHGDILTAYLEGPISCSNGWFCRILEDENWDPQNLIGDENFGYCNNTEESLDNLPDGHCHGSSENSAFYWFVRDHWFRRYNGRLRCCCGWTTLSDTNIVNRCDYRRAISRDESAGGCFDASVDELFYEGGCKDVGAEIEEDDDQCWEVQRFGNVDDESGDSEDDESESSSESIDGEGSEDYDYESESVSESIDGEGNEECNYNSEADDNEVKRDDIYGVVLKKLHLLNKLHRS